MCMYVPCFHYGSGMPPLYSPSLVATILNVYMADGAMKFLANATTDSARLLFRRSLYHLPIVMGAAVAFRLPQESCLQQQQQTQQPLLDGQHARSELRGAGHPTPRGADAAPTRERRAWGDTLDRLAPSNAVTMDTAGHSNSQKATETLKLDIQAAPFPFLPPPSWSVAKSRGDARS